MMPRRCRSTLSRPARLAVTSAAFCAVAWPALADLTPREVWEELAGYMRESGYTLSADAREGTRAGARSLTVADLTLTAPLPTREGGSARGEGGGTMTVTLGTLTLTDRGDGTVAIALPDRMPIAVEGRAADGARFGFAADYIARNLSLIASGTPDDVAYDVAADGVGIELTRVDGAGGAATISAGRVMLDDVSGRATMSDADTGANGAGAHVVEQDLVAGALTYAIDVSNAAPGEEATLRMEGTAEDIVLEAGSEIPRGYDRGDMPAALAAGYTMEWGLSYGPGRGTFDFRESSRQVQADTQSRAGTLRFSLAADGLGYHLRQEEMRVVASGSDVPVPLDLTAEEIALSAQTPVTAGDAVRPFALALGLRRVAIPDLLWAVIDPQGRLSHEPLTLALDVTGTGRLFVDLMDGARLSPGESDGTPPGEIETLKLEALELRGGGAEVTAKADLGLDNDAKSPFGDFPNVFGTADVRLTGVLGLIETLADMGLVPIPPAMVFSGIAAQLGQQVNGPDDLKATLKLSPQGALSINGLPIPLQ